MKEYWADYDEETALFCVFDTETGFAYSSWASMEQAQADADKRNRDQSQYTGEWS